MSVCACWHVFRHTLVLVSIVHARACVHKRIDQNGTGNGAWAGECGVENMRTLCVCCHAKVKSSLVRPVSSTLNPKPFTLSLVADNLDLCGLRPPVFAPICLCVRVCARAHACTCVVGDGLWAWNGGQVTREQSQERAEARRLAKGMQERAGGDHERLRRRRRTALERGRAAALRKEARMRATRCRRQERARLGMLRADMLGASGANRAR